MTPPIKESDAEEIAEKVVHRIFMILGTDISNSEDIKELQKDFAHARAWRESMDTVKSKGLGTAVAFIVTALLGYALLFFTNR